MQVPVVLEAARGYASKHADMSQHALPNQYRGSGLQPEQVTCTPFSNLCNRHEYHADRPPPDNYI